MKRRGRIRRVLLPALWLVIGVCVAASLVKLAFLGGTAAARADDPLKPTGEVPSGTAAVEAGDVKNTLTVEGTIELEPAKSALSPAEGVLIHSWVSEGAVVEAGDQLFQVRSEAMAEQVAETLGGEGPRASRATAPPRYAYATVVAPVGGRVSGFAVALGDPVSKGLAIASVQPNTYKAVGNITPLDRYRLLQRPTKARVTINGGPKPFTCLGLAIGDEATAAAPTNPEEGGMSEGGGGDSATTITCRVPDDVTVFDGLSMLMEIAAGAARDVLVVPVTSVRGLLGTGTVWVVGKDDRQTHRQVRLGITDGKVVEVRSGLKAGETVLRYVPGSTPEGEGGMHGMEGMVEYG